jgi:hypothetical protein
MTDRMPRTMRNLRRRLLRLANHLGLYCWHHGWRWEPLQPCTECSLDEISRWSRRIQATPDLLAQVMRGDLPSFTLADAPEDYCADDAYVGRGRQLA